MNKQNVKVTTTSGFDGVEIEEYLEPITAHVVVGMNLFKDLLSGFSDLFGGKSRTYQNTLTSINDDVINELRERAYSIGANCVLGLKIDNDEVSAQGKSMMMVTALGTAAKANFSEKTINHKKEIKADRLSNDLLNFYKQKKKYIVESENDSLKINDELWEFVKSNKVNELAEYLLDSFLEFAKFYEVQENFKKFSNHLSEYLSVLDPEVAMSCLYKRLIEEQELDLKNQIIKKINELQLIDFERVLQLIKAPDFSTQKCSLQVLKTDKMSYEKPDIQQIKNIISLVSTTFTERGKKTSKKKALSSKEKEIWICECSKENDKERTYCSSCKRDIFGFSENETNAEQISKKLKSELEILEKVIA